MDTEAAHLAGVDSTLEPARPISSSQKPRVVYRHGEWYAEIPEHGSAAIKLGITGASQAALAAQRAVDASEQARESMSLAAMCAAVVREYRINDRHARSIRRATQAFSLFAAHVGNLPVDQITCEHLHGYVEMRMETVTRGTVKAEITILKKAFRLWLSYGRLQKLPAFPILRPPAPRKGFLDEEQVERICELLNPEVAPMIRFLHWTGWRRGEAMGLQWPSVDFQIGTVRLEPGTTKNDEAREFPFRYAPALETVLREQRELVNHLERVQHVTIPWVFCRYNGGPIVSLTVTWDNARRTVGLPAALVHDLRRSAVRRLELAGVPRSIAMRLTGHKTERVYSAYAITAPQDLAEGVRRLNEYVEQNKRQVPRQESSSSKPPYNDWEI